MWKSPSSQDQTFFLSQFLFCDSLGNKEEVLRTASGTEIAKALLGCGYHCSLTGLWLNSASCQTAPWHFLSFIIEAFDTLLYEKRKRGRRLSIKVYTKTKQKVVASFHFGGLNAKYIVWQRIYVYCVQWLLCLRFVYVLLAFLLGDVKTNVWIPWCRAICLEWIGKVLEMNTIKTFL